MMCQHKEDAVDVDDPKATNGHSLELKENGLLLHPVSPQEGGEGLPYAPVNWPNPGDTWGWRVGKRTAVSGYYLDRYLYLPSRLQKSRKGKEGFASKLSVKQYIQAMFPDADVEAFFASFSWKVPSKQAFLIKGHHDFSCMLSEEMTEQSSSDSQNGGPACKAGNRSCPSLTEEVKIQPEVTTMFCDICCSEPNFCRDCCCILCCKTIDLAYGGYSFIRCEAKVHGGLICGHAAHLICALRSYMAGTVGETIGLDAEYYCRRCDSRTGLVEHVTKIFKTCKSVESTDDVKKMLNLVVCLMRGSQKRDVKRLVNRAQLALQRFECGKVLSDIWEVEDDVSTVKTVEDELDVRDSGQQTPPPAAGLSTECQKLNDEIDRVLQELRKSQQHEYKIAQNRLLSQGDRLFQLYQQLETEKSELAQRSSAVHSDGLCSIARTEKKIKRATKRLKNMENVGKGFGRAPRDILDKYFDLDVED